ncbi:MAG TPA: exodeoxyribonuclease VII large subunit [Anaerolineae bacterium]|nr:exodeoxyribonuclease VII large subunit [Anaerolineae bacterium]
MIQPALFDYSPRVYTVSEINSYLRRKFEVDPHLQEVWLQGEISNWRPAASGHIYFTLKDALATIRCVIWRSTAQQLLYRPQRDGEAILARGHISIYEAGGNYQFYVEDLEPAGQGALYAEFERIKARLAAEGLFDPALKQPLPLFPHRIGVVTSPTAAAWRDILNVLRRRFPLAEVILSPTQVQGETAPLQIVAALTRLLNQPVEVIIIARGGGSLEDLWAFNDERVARAIAACPIPTVVGVGHETDFTIADFVADVRAPTPSAAAELVSPDSSDLRQQVSELQTALVEASQQQLDRSRRDLEQQSWALARLSPQTRINNHRQQIDLLASRATRAQQHQLTLRRQQVEHLAARLATLNPDSTQSRGYAIVQKDQTVISQTGQVADGDLIVVRVSDGRFEAIVQPSSSRS